MMFASLLIVRAKGEVITKIKERGSNFKRPIPKTPRRKRIIQLIRMLILVPITGMKKKVVKIPPIIEPSVERENIFPELMPMSSLDEITLIKYGGTKDKRIMGRKNRITTANNVPAITGIPEIFFKKKG